MAVNVKSVLACVGIDTSSDVSVLFHGFGFIRARVPTDPDSTVRAEVSLLDTRTGHPRRAPEPQRHQGRLRRPTGFLIR